MYIIILNVQNGMRRPLEAAVQNLSSKKKTKYKLSCYHVNFDVISVFTNSQNINKAIKNQVGVHTTVHDL